MSSLRKDLISISGLQEDYFKKVVKIAVGDGATNMDWVVYLETINEEVKEGSQALFRLLNYVGSAFSDARNYEKESSELDEFIAKLSKGNDEASRGWERIKESYSALNTFFISKKEEAIKSRFSSVDETSITVDARPVFSLDKSSIEKVLFPYILKIETCDDKTFFCELYPEQLELLEEEIKNAKQKKISLEELIGSQD